MSFPPYVRTPVSLKNDILVSSYCLTFVGKTLQSCAFWGSQF